MGFEPFSGEHAIQRVGFGCILSEPLDITALREVHSRRVAIQADLPATIFKENGEPDLQFAHLRPNGSATWALRLTGHTIYVENTRYTRWDRIWAQAQIFFNFALGALPQDTFKVNGCGLKVSDRFRTPVETYNLKELLAENDLVPDHVFNHGPKWRMDYDWNDAFDGGEISSNLDISTRISDRLDRQNNETRSFVSVIIDHTQESALDQPLELAEAMNSKPLGIADIMGQFHARNKNCINSILTDEMKQKIKLWGEA